MARPDWHTSPVFSELLEEPLLRLCAYYLHDRRQDNTPIDPVERFHLGNGAVLEQLNWQGDISANGVRQAFGLMVNFSLYVFINVAMVMGLIPVVGAPLPLISYGGTAMLAALIGFGLIISCNVHRDSKLPRM